MKAVTKDEYLAALAVVRTYRKQKGRTPTKQWLIEHPEISVRLAQILAVASNYPEYQFIEDFTEEKFFKIRNAGNRSWAELQEELNQTDPFTNLNTDFSIDFPVHPATCDRSGGDSCERNNKTGEGEMKCIEGNFICPCGKYIQHKCLNQ